MMRGCGTRDFERATFYEPEFGVSACVDRANLSLFLMPADYDRWLTVLRHG